MTVDHGLDITRASRRLLDSDVAVTAAWPSEKSIRVGRRFRSIGSQLTSARHLNASMTRVFETHTWRSAIGVSLNHPRFASGAVKSVWAEKTRADMQQMLEKTTLRSLLLLLAKHPIFGPTKVLPHVRWSPLKKNEPENEDAAGPDFSATPHDPEWAADAIASLNEAESLMLNEQGVSAVERYHDERLFGGRDREEDRLVRLLLRNTYHEVRLPGPKIETQRVTFEPRLFLHESGVVQITILLSTDGRLDIDQIVELMWGSAPRIIRSEVGEMMLKGTEFGERFTEWSDERDAGARLAIIEHEAPMSMIEVGLAYLQVVERVMRRRMRFYNNHPIAILQAGKCCAASVWRDNHADELKRLTLRVPTGKALAAHVTLGTDLSGYADHSLHVNASSTAYVQVEGEAPRGVDQLHTVLLIEYALVLYRRLMAMEEVVGKMRLGERRLKNRYRAAIRLFSELRQGDVRAGEARDIIRHLLADLGADQMRATIESALNMASMAHATESASKASRRAWWLALVATVVGVVVSIPPLQAILATVAQTPTGGPLEGLLRFVRPLAADPFTGVWYIVGWLLVGLVGLWVVGWLARHRLTWPYAIRRGYAWPTPIEVVDHDESDEEDDPNAIK